MKTPIYVVCFLCILTSTLFSNEVIKNIEDNWNQISSMSGEFQQLDSDGNISIGKFFFLKPYLSKFIYEDRPENIITNKLLLRIVDQENYQIDSYPIGNNILKKILSKNLNIEEDLNIKSLKSDNGFYEIEFFTSSDNTNNRALLFFNKKTLDLKKWVIFDEFDNKTVLEFTNIKKNISISENLFVVKYKQN